MVRKPDELPRRRKVPLSIPFAHFRLLRFSLKGFLTHVVKYIFFPQDGPHPPKLQRNSRFHIGSLWRGLPMLQIMRFFPHRIVLVRKPRGSGAHLMMSLYSDSLAL